MARKQTGDVSLAVSRGSVLCHCQAAGFDAEQVASRCGCLFFGLPREMFAFHEHVLKFISSFLQVSEVMVAVWLCTRTSCSMYLHPG